MGVTHLPDLGSWSILSGRGESKCRRNPAWVIPSTGRRIAAANRRAWSFMTFAPVALGCAARAGIANHSEMGLTLILIEARIMPNDVRLRLEEQAIVLRHAIARRFERGYPATSEAVIDDLRHVAHTRLTEPTTLVVTTDSGRWMGRLGNYEDRETLVISTFLPPDIRGGPFYGR
jgi:hypothetical protein